jgi:opacity protein-like surface antigen
MPQTNRRFPALLVLAAVVCCADAASAQSTAAPPVAAKPAPAIPRKWKFEFEGSHGELSGNHGDEGQYTFTLDRIVNRRVTLSAGVDQHDRFDELDTQLVVGGQMGFPTRRTLLEGTYTEGFGAEMAARHGVDLQYSFQATRHIRPEFEYEYDRYIHGYYLHRTTAGVALLPSAKLQAELKFQNSQASEDKGGNSGTAGLQYVVNERVTIIAGAGYGHEHFLAKSVNEVRSELTALGVTGEVDFSLRHHQVLKVEWEYQDRRSAYSTNLLTVTYSKSF